MLYRRRPACLTRQGRRSFLPEVPLRAAVLIAFAGLSLIALAGFVSRGGSSEDVQPATIEVGDNWFCDPGDTDCMISDIDVLDLTTTVSIGDTVTWNFVEGTDIDAHTTTSIDGGVWDSGQVDAPGTFSLTFDTAGIFIYRCETHPFQMLGVIVVEAAEPSPAPTPSPEGSPETSPQPSPASISPTPDMPPLPGGGGAPPAQAGTSIPWWLAIAGGGLLMASASLLVLRLRR